VKESPSAHRQSSVYQLPVTSSKRRQSPAISTHHQPMDGNDLLLRNPQLGGCPERPTSFVITMKNNNNTEMKVKDMRTTTRHKLTPTNRFANQQPIKLPVDFKPGRSSVLPVHIVATREYLRDLRAAEMKEWERSGGDFLAS
jgi:hypothetical protein